MNERAQTGSRRRHVYAWLAAGASALALWALLAGVPIGAIGLLYGQWKLAVAGPVLMLSGYFLLHLARSLLLVLGIRNRYTRLFEGDYSNILVQDDLFYFVGGACCLFFGLLFLTFIDAEMGPEATRLLFGAWEVYTPVLLAAGVALWTGLLAALAAGAVWACRENARANPQILEPRVAREADRAPELRADEQNALAFPRCQRFIREKQRLVLILSAGEAIFFGYVFLVLMDRHPIVGWTVLGLLVITFAAMPLYLLADARHTRLSILPRKLVLQTRENRVRWSRRGILWQDVTGLTIERFPAGEIRALQIEHDGKHDAIVGFEQMEELAAAVQEHVGEGLTSTATLKLNRSSIAVQLAVAAALCLSGFGFLSLPLIVRQFAFYGVLLVFMIRPVRKATLRFFFE